MGIAGFAGVDLQIPHCVLLCGIYICPHMETKHTPGPWTAHYAASDALFVGPPDGDAPVICDLVSRLDQYDEETKTYTQVFQDEDLANAHLIAAAPDLLEALKSLMEAASDGSASALLKPMFEAATAIAKAEGKEVSRG